MNDILITRDTRGKIRIVDISCQWEDKLHGFALVRKTYQWEGKITEQPIIEIDCGKAGRTVTEQATLTYNSHVKKYLDKGYKNIKDFGFDSLDDCNPNELMPMEVTDQHGVRKPMLAKKADDCAVSVFEHEFLGSKKLDGVRCLLYWDIDHIATASRGGTDYNVAATYITQDLILINYLKENPSVVLDGELYIHGRSLPYISGLCRLQTLEERHKELKYWIYDLAIPDVIFKDRLTMLEEIGLALEGTEKIVMVEHVPICSWSNIKKLHDKYVKEGFEGCVIRNPSKEYGFNKRDNRMIKVKEFEDAEFEIVGITEGLRPEDMCFSLKAKNGKLFDAKPIGDRKLKEWYRSNLSNIIGKFGTVKYFGLTPYGIPNLPVFKAVREIIE